MKITEQGMNILVEKEYFKKGETEWEHLVDRVAHTISNAEPTTELRKTVRDKINKAMNRMEFCFSSPALINANPDVNNPGQYSSCFIIGIKDDLMSIMEAVPRMAKIFQKAGGVGVSNISILRPAKTTVEKSNGYSCGPLGFMEIYNTTAEVMTRENKSKRGALKINMDIWHPDIIDFINCKNEDGKLPLMNISVSAYDDFEEAVEKNADWDLIFPDFETMDKKVYDKEWNGDIYAWREKGYPIKVYKTVKARELKRMADEAMWKRGEPGWNYQSRMNNDNKNKHIGTIIYTNPCNEFSNLIDTSCTLGSINFMTCISISKKDGKPYVNYRKFKKLIKDGVRWLDDMVSVNKLPLSEIQEMSDKIRAIGLGIMGFGTSLFKLGIRYGSKECINFINEIGTVLYDTALKASMELADEKGVYPAWKGSEWEKQGIKVRNSNFISIAPNGTISTLAGVSGGIEPEFALVYWRRTNNGNSYPFLNPIFLEAIEAIGLDKNIILEKVQNNHGSCQGIDEIPQEIQDVFVTAHDITPEEHIKVVGAWQQHTDLSISKTINFKNDATVEDISDIIMQGWKAGCKGLAVYRDGSRKFQTLSSTKQDEDSDITTQVINMVKDLSESEKMDIINKILPSNNISVENIEVGEIGNLEELLVENENKCATCTGNACGKHDPVELLGVDYSTKKNSDHSAINIAAPEMNTVSRKDFGEKLAGNTYTRESACGKFYVTLNRDPRNGKIIETFVNVKNGLCKSNVDANTRLISLCLRNDIPMEDVIEQLKGISCAACTNTLAKGNKKIDGISCPDIMAKLLEKELQIAKNKQQKKTVEFNELEEPLFINKVQNERGFSNIVKETTEAIKEYASDRFVMNNPLGIKLDNKPTTVEAAKSKVFYNAVKNNLNKDNKISPAELDRINLMERCYIAPYEKEKSREELLAEGICPDCGNELPPGRCIQCVHCGFATC